MHRGSFPRPPRPLSDPAPYARDVAAPAPESADVPPPEPAALSRRGWLLVAASAVAVPLAALYGGMARPVGGRDGDERPAGDADAPGQRGAAANGVEPPAPAAAAALAPQWAVALQYATDVELIAAAGDLEMVSSRFRSDRRLVPCFVRLLDIVLGGSHSDGDAAGACAVRSLHRLGRADLVQAQRSAVARRPDLAATQRAVERILEGRHRRGGR